MIQFEQVSKHYSDRIQALNSLSFSIASGEMVFIAGHSGAGKSTLLKLVAAIERPTSGQITVNGYNISKATDAQLCYMRQHIGVVFQDHKILFDRNVADNVMLPLDMVGMGRKEAKRRVQAALDKVNLLGKEKVAPIQLSGGEQQRLCIARAVVHRPAILLADEPSANLDRDCALDIMELLQSFHQSGVTVLISAHDETLMEDYGRRILRLKSGQFIT